MKIPFNRPFMTGDEMGLLEIAHSRGQLAGNGYFTNACCQYLEDVTGASRTLLTHSATAALEMSAILANVGPGSEVILPSYTFVSTANAFVMRGATPVFVDIRKDTLNIDESIIQEAITSRTRVIVPVHYAGVPCDMDSILRIARETGALVVEDAAQALGSTYRNRPVGAIGDMGAFSFHETKNVQSGEGGALNIRSDELVERAEVVWEKGTNRTRFFRGQVDRYTWEDVGSSYLPGELVAAFLWGQLQSADMITKRRLKIWNHYRLRLQPLADLGALRLPFIPGHVTHNAHMFQIRVADLNERTRFIDFMQLRGIGCVFHYVPLHTSPMGLKVGRTVGNMAVTSEVSETLVRLPLWLGVEEFQNEIIEGIFAFFGKTE